MERAHFHSDMSASYNFDPNWYILLFSFLLLWLILLISRKKYNNTKEAKEQLYLALTGLFALALMEVFATSTNLWHYVSGDWPIILWPTYFAAILFGYQLLRYIEGPRR
jgi:phosphatidylserine synthase